VWKSPKSPGPREDEVQVQGVLAVLCDLTGAGVRDGYTARWNRRALGEGVVGTQPCG